MSVYGGVVFENEMKRAVGVSDMTRKEPYMRVVRAERFIRAKTTGTISTAKSDNAITPGRLCGTVTSELQLSVGVPLLLKRNLAGDKVAQCRRPA